MKLRIKEVYPYHDTHCIGRSEPNNVFIYNGISGNHGCENQTNESLERMDKSKSKTMMLTKSKKW